MLKKRRRREQHERGGIRAIGEWKYTTLLLSVVVGTMFVLLVVLVWRVPRQKPIGDFDGVIVDRWAGYNESDYGSKPYFRLLVEIENSKRITIGVEPDLYHRSKVGMGVKNRNGRVELVEAPVRIHTLK